MSGDGRFLGFNFLLFFFVFHGEVKHHNHLRTFIEQNIGTGRDKMMIRQRITHTKEIAKEKKVKYLKKN